jgi:predicted phage terminase large subunit-like protein
LKTEEPALPWLHINLPNEAEARKTYAYGNVSYDRAAGELLNEERFGWAETAEFKRRLGPNYDGQFQQRPTKMAGDLLKTKWLKQYEADPRTIRAKMEHVYFGCDLAATEKQLDKDDPDYSVIAVCGRDALGDFYVLDLWREQCATPTFVDQLFLMNEKWQPHVVWIEKGGLFNSVLPWIQLRVSDSGQFIPYAEADCNGIDKVGRAAALQGLAKSGQLFVHARATWLPPLLNEWAAFPRGAHDDQIDALAHLARNANRMIQADKDKDPDQGPQEGHLEWWESLKKQSKRDKGGSEMDRLLPGDDEYDEFFDA